MAKEETTKAAEVGENQEPAIEMNSKELREKERAMCNTEIKQVLDKYGCELTAQMVITETRAIPQVFIRDARS